MAGPSGDAGEEPGEALVVDGVVGCGEGLGDDAAQIVASPTSLIGLGRDEQREPSLAGLGVMARSIEVDATHVGQCAVE